MGPASSIGANDLLIAAHAMVPEPACVTTSTRESSGAEGLRSVDWRS